MAGGESKSQTRKNKEEKVPNTEGKAKSQTRVMTYFFSSIIMDTTCLSVSWLKLVSPGQNAPYSAQKYFKEVD